MRKKRRKLHIKEILICLVLCAIPVVLGFSHVQSFSYVNSLFDDYEEFRISKREMHNGVETVDIREYLTEAAGGDFYTTRHSAPNGDTIVSGSLRGATDEAVVLQSLHITGDAQIHFYENNNFEELPLEEGKYDPSLFFIDSESFDIACYTPKQYRMLENEALEYLPDSDGYLNVKKTSDGFDIEIVTGKVDISCCTDFMLVYSTEDIMDWESHEVDKEWLAFTMDGENRWTYTGYYRISPDTYYPTGPNVYYRCQACYLGNSFITANPRYRVMDDMLLCIIDTMALQQNELGYFPSTSLSEWLNEDYNINEDYYDTRFNSDLAEIFINAYDIYMNNTAYIALEKYADFFMNMAEESAWDDGEGGIFVPDYWDSEAWLEKVHTSLNHQLAEMSVLYKLSDILKRPELGDLADKMLKGIENAGFMWLRADHDLHYCIYPNYTFGLPDYPELTYNDMFKMQQLLEARRGYRSEMMDKIMSYKLEWMIAHKVTTYLK